MEKYVNSEVNQHIMKLLMIGAKVQIVSGKMIYVKFKLENDIEVSYVYHINKNNKYFLERIQPYPLSIKEFDSDTDVINIIQIDLDQFQNAIGSTKIREFININQNLHKTIKAFEDLFLYYNVPTTLVNEIKESTTKIQESIKKAAKECERLFFEKDPENLE